MRKIYQVCVLALILAAITRTLNRFTFKQKTLDHVKSYLTAHHRKVIRPLSVCFSVFFFVLIKNFYKKLLYRKFSPSVKLASVLGSKVCLAKMARVFQGLEDNENISEFLS